MDEEISIVAMRESTVKGVWKSPEQREKAVDWTRPVDWIWSWGEWGGAREEDWERRDQELREPRQQKPREQRESMAEMAGLCRNEKLGEEMPGSWRSSG